MPLSKTCDTQMNQSNFFVVQLGIFQLKYIHYILLCLIYVIFRQSDIRTCFAERLVRCVEVWKLQGSSHTLFFYFKQLLLSLFVWTTEWNTRSRRNRLRCVLSSPLLNNCHASPLSVAAGFCICVTCCVIAFSLGKSNFIYVLQCLAGPMAAVQDKRAGHPLSTRWTWLLFCFTVIIICLIDTCCGLTDNLCQAEWCFIVGSSRANSIVSKKN